MTTEFGNNGNTFSKDIRLYGSDIAMLMAGKKIVSAVPHNSLKHKNNKTYEGIVVKVDGVDLEVGFMPWELRNFTIVHYPKKNVPTSVKMDDVLHTAAFDALVGCKGDNEVFLKNICSAIIGKFSGMHISNGQTTKGASFPQTTWIVTNDAEKAIVDITKTEEEKKEA
jgi:hypothetical protein